MFDCLYDQSVGRFLNADPIGIAGGINQFGYCGGDPVNFADPTGLWATGSYAGDVGQVFVGYGRALYGMVSPILHPRQTLRELGALWTYGQNCGVGSASRLVLGAMWKSHTEWATTSDPATFGESFGTLLTTVATAATPSPKTPCFPAGTDIATLEGEKPIEKVRAGDTVLSADPATGVKSYQQVVRTFVRQADELLTIRTEDGQGVRTTSEHPFWVEGKGFVAAKNLARSDLLRKVDGRSARILQVTRVSGRVAVYNFEVEGTHTYFAEGLWVHNACNIGAARSALNRGATSVRVATRSQAEQLLWERWGGYRNLTDSAPGEALNAFRMKDKYYHWDEVFEPPQMG